MQFSKYHALGNDYIVVEGKDWDRILTPAAIQRVCHRQFGIGSDGILVRYEGAGGAPFRLRILNPDGSEAEKSGNGLRIFARYLWDRGEVKDAPFTVETPGGIASCRVFSEGKTVEVDMGQVTFESTKIPVLGPSREVLRETFVIGGVPLEYCAAGIGNPHCVILRAASKEDAVRFGPLIETEPRFPHKTNVQFLEVLDRKNIRLEIWERGAGYTLASGSSSSAAAAVARKLGLVEDRVTVHMPGGELSIEMDADFFIRMTGPVTRVAEGKMSLEALGG